MTSHYARHGSLSEETLYYYHYSNRSLTDRITFYINYFYDVAPYGVNVHHERGLPANNPMQAIQLRTPSEQIFMSGIVTMEPNTQHLENYAANRSYGKWRGGSFVPDGNCWRFFTATTKLSMYVSFGGDNWELMGRMDPIRDVREVVRLLQNQYDSLGY